jgi:hypothetical protein
MIPIPIYDAFFTPEAVSFAKQCLIFSKFSKAVGFLFENPEITHLRIRKGASAPVTPISFLSCHKKEAKKSRRCPLRSKNRRSSS